MRKGRILLYRAATRTGRWTDARPLWRLQQSARTIRRISTVLFHVQFFRTSVRLRGLSGLKSLLATHDADQCCTVVPLLFGYRWLRQPRTDEFDSKTAPVLQPECKHTAVSSVLTRKSVRPRHSAELNVVMSLTKRLMDR